MSHYTEVNTVFQDPDAIRCALAEAYDCEVTDVIVSEEGQDLRGYNGQNRSALNVNSPDYAPPCEIVLPRQFVPGASNDIGFKKKEDGTYQAYISKYDASHWNKCEKTFNTAYGKAVLEKQAQKHGWEVGKIEKKENGDLTVIVKQSTIPKPSSIKKKAKGKKSIKLKRKQ